MSMMLSPASTEVGDGGKFARPVDNADDDLVDRAEDSFGPPRHQALLRPSQIFSNAIASARSKSVLRCLLVSSSMSRTSRIASVGHADVSPNLR